MDKRYRTYTPEFKLKALELLKHSGKSAAQLERELGITRGLLLKWRDRYQIRREQGEASLVPTDLARCRRRCGDCSASWLLSSRSATS